MSAATADMLDTSADKLLREKSYSMNMSEKKAVLGLSILLFVGIASANIVFDHEGDVRFSDTDLDLDSNDIINAGILTVDQINAADSLVYIASNVDLDGNSILNGGLIEIESISSNNGAISVESDIDLQNNEIMNEKSSGSEFDTGIKSVSSGQNANTEKVSSNVDGAHITDFYVKIERVWGDEENPPGGSQVGRLTLVFEDGSEEEITVSGNGAENLEKSRGSANLNPDNAEKNIEEIVLSAENEVYGACCNGDVIVKASWIE